MKILRILLILSAFVAIILLTHKVILPYVMDVAKSRAFLTDSTDLGEPYVISTPMTDLALMHCNQYINDEYGENRQIQFSEQPLNAWDIGDHTYIINSEIEYINDEGKSQINKFACRISYDNKDDDEGVMNYENWSVYGLSGLDAL